MDAFAAFDPVAGVGRDVLRRLVPGADCHVDHGPRRRCTSAHRQSQTRGGYHLGAVVVVPGVMAPG
jgi:hypothetical protein